MSRAPRQGAPFRLATFNVNGVNTRLPNLLLWLKTSQPDAVCLQELKCTDAAFPVDALAKAGYGAVWQGEARWNGVAILARGADPVLTRRRLPGDAADRQSRYIEAAVGGILIGNLYAPNGNPQPGPKFAYKLAWLRRLLAHARSLQDMNVPAVLAGDYNIVSTDADIYTSASWAKNALVQPEPRGLFHELAAGGWTDALLACHPGGAPFTFWDYMRGRWQRNAGMRLDHLMLSPAVATWLASAGVDRDVRGVPNASDHAPAWAELRPVHRPVAG